MVTNDLISRQAAIDAMNTVYCHIEMIKKRPVNKTEQAMYLDMIGAVKSVPPVDVAEVKHGRWFWQGSISEGGWVCSECKHKFYYIYGNENFCPNCGAKMDAQEGGTDEGSY